VQQGEGQDEADHGYEHGVEQGRLHLVVEDDRQLEDGDRHHGGNDEAQGDHEVEVADHGNGIH
jgi:hypothetical protein